MTSLLHLDSAAHRSSESVSRQLTALFADLWRRQHPTGGYRYRDLAADPVPPLDTAYCALGRRVEARGLVPLDAVAALAESQAEVRQWALTRPLVDELRSADTVLIGAPMYNHSVPAALKAWIDRVSFPGTFADSPLRDTTVVLVCPRGGTYGPGGQDFHTPYLRAYFGGHGVAEPNLHLVTAELTVAGFVPQLAGSRQAAARSLAAARARVTALAAALAVPA